VRLQKILKLLRIDLFFVVTFSPTKANLQRSFFIPNFNGVYLCEQTIKSIKPLHSLNALHENHMGAAGFRFDLNSARFRHVPALPDLLKAKFFLRAVTWVK